MINNRPGFKLLIIFQAVFFLALTVGESQAAKKKNKDDKRDQSYVMTEAELQAQVMAFADRYVALIMTASSEYVAQSPSPENRRIIRSQLVFSIANAFSIAAGPDPDFALLDMVVMITMGRLIFEEHYMKKYGNEFAPIVKRFRLTEKDIWQIAGRVLSKQQQKELMAMIRDWRRNNPEVIAFSYIRFRDFAIDQKKSKSSKQKKPSGLFGSVEKATQQVEEMRLLAERGLYLGTRMPLMTGAFADVWVSQLAVNPDVRNIVADLHQLSEVSQRMAVVAEKLPEDIAKERQTTIDQLVDHISKERKRTINQLVEQIARERRRTIEEFIAEEKRMRGLLTDLKQTLNSGNDLLTSANTLVERLNLGQADTETTTPSKPFDIKDYQTTLVEASSVIQQLHGLVRTVDQMGLEKTLPQIIKAIEQVEKHGVDWVVFAFFLGIALILLFLVGSVIAMLAYRYFYRRIFEPSQEQAES